MIAHDFEYVKATSLDDAIAALSTPGARVLAGGTDVVPWLRDQRIEPEMLVDIKEIPGLGEFSVDGNQVTIGALVTFSDVISSEFVTERVPMLVEMATHVASVGVRNRATVVGNVCSAVPSLDAGPALMVYDAEVMIVGAGGERRVALEDWFLGPRSTGLAAGELVTGVTIGVPEADHAGAFLKLARYSGEDLAQANLAVLVTADLRYRLAFGAVAPYPIRARSIEDLLTGHELDDSIVEAAMARVQEEIAPITDIRATAAYRSHMCRVMVRRGLWAATHRLAGSGPPYPTDLI